MGVVYTDGKMLPPHLRADFDLGPDPRRARNGRSRKEAEQCASDE